MATEPLPQDVLDAAESIYDGWYASSGRIDWDDFLYRLEKWTDYDLGNDMLSSEIKQVKAHIRKYRQL